MEEFIRNLFKDVIENNFYDENLINHYFSEYYRQTVDNLTLDFDAFKMHLKKLKTKCCKQEVIFENIVTNTSFIFTKHYVTSQLNCGEIVKHKVLAEFQFKHNKIIRCDELTILIDGNTEEKTLGSEV